MVTRDNGGADGGSAAAGVDSRDSAGRGMQEAAAAPVRAYLDAIVAGRAAEALRLLPVDGGESAVDGGESAVDGGESAVDGGASTALLNDAVYRAATLPSGYTVTNVSVDSDQATVLADIELDGQTSATTFVLKRDTGTGSTDAWTLVDGPSSSIRVGNVHGVRQVNGVAVDLSDVPAGSVLPALPGIYRFAAPPDTAAVTYGDEQSVVVAPQTSAAGGDAAVTFTPALSESGKQQAIQDVRAHIQHCMLSDAFRPDGCPNVLEMKDPVVYATTAITRTWMRQPQYAVVGGPAVAGSRGYAVRVSGGDMHIAYKWRYAEGEDWKPNDLTDDDVFDRRSPDGTDVQITIDEDGIVSLDYDEF